MPNDLEQYEKYLHGEPINEELARMREGLEGEGSPFLPVPRRETVDAGRALKRRERLELKEAVRSEGWRIVERLQEKLDQMHEKCAITLSQDNPLANRNRIAEEWAYRAMFRRAMAELNMAIEKELTALDEEDGR